MSETDLIPSIEQRLEGLLEMRRRGEKVRVEGHPPVITLSREYGCEAYPTAEALQRAMEHETNHAWALMDKALLEVVSKDHELAALFDTVGERVPMFDNLSAAFSPGWRTQDDCYRVLCRLIFSLAQQGWVILVGRGASLLTQHMENCYHFRIVAPFEFRANALRRRLNLAWSEAVKMVEEKQHRRDTFIRDFLGRDIADPLLYHLIFNNEKNTPAQMARTITRYVVERLPQKPP